MGFLVSSFFVVLVGAEIILKATTGPDGVVPICESVKVHDACITTSLHSYQAWRLHIGSNYVWGVNLYFCLPVSPLLYISVYFFSVSSEHACVLMGMSLEARIGCCIYLSELPVVVSHPKQVLGSELLTQTLLAAEPSL